MDNIYHDQKYFLVMNISEEDSEVYHGSTCICSVQSRRLHSHIFSMTKRGYWAQNNGQTFVTGQWSE